MKTVLICNALALMLVAVATSALAQQTPRPQLHVVVEMLWADAAKCGVSVSQVESIAALTLRNNGIQAASEVTNPLLYVQVGLLALSDRLCVLTLNASVEGLTGSAKGSIGAFKVREGVSSTLLCRVPSIQTTLNASTAITPALENVIKVCLGKLDY